MKTFEIIKIAWLYQANHKELLEHFEQMIRASSWSNCWLVVSKLQKYNIFDKYY
jgi:hypothetical protein